MYLNTTTLKILEEISKINTSSSIVKSWAKKYCINEKTLAVIWRRAELLAAKGKKCNCIPWGVATDIFKLSVRKHFKMNKCNRKDINPTIIRGRYVRTNKDVEPGGALVKKYEIEIKKLEEECPNFDKLPDCIRSLNENVNSNLIEESPHKDNPYLTKTLSRNQPFRQNLAEKLKYLRRARDKARIHKKNYKANAIDNVSRALTNAPANDPTLRNLSTTKLSNMENRSNLLNYLPKKTNLPPQRFDKIKDRIDQEHNSLLATPNRISNYIDKDDVSKYQDQLRRFNNLSPINDNILEMFKYSPRLAGVKREINPLIDYNQSKSSLKFY